MSFVVFDVETTGLQPRFDQILQFAAVRADANLQAIDRIDLRIRLMPHIVPSPTALQVNGTDIAAILASAVPSHYECVCKIAAQLRAWSPAVFLGYNSIRFDEEFLRQALYTCLHPAFLTNTNGNARADILNLARATAVLAPSALRIPEEEGRPCFRLEALARANGFAGGAAHDAGNDVDAALHVCRIVAENAPDLWSRFLRFAQRRVAAEFVSDEDVFVFFDQVGSTHSTHIVASLGASPTRSNLHFCIDLKADIAALAAMDAAALAEALAAPARPVRRLRLNTAPLLIPLYEASPQTLDGETEDEYCARARAVRDDPEFVARLIAAALSCERVFEDSPHVEEQIYSGEFPSVDETALMQRFHAVEWPHRRDVAAQLTDPRNRALAIRLLYLERPDLLPVGQRIRMSEAIQQRRRGEAQSQPACLTVQGALAELDELRARSGDDVQQSRLNELEIYLKSLLQPSAYAG